MEATKQKIAWTAFFAAIGLGFFYYSNFSEDSFVVAVICMGIAFILYWFGRPWYTLSLHTAGGRYRPLKSREYAYIGKVLTAINEAIMRRG
jgi:hypothetical protein